MEPSFLVPPPQPVLTPGITRREELREDFKITNGIQADSGRVHAVVGPRPTGKGREAMESDYHTPPEIIKAIHQIARYLKARGYVQVVINQNSGASFRKTDVYKELLHWQNEADRNFKEQVGWDEQDGERCPFCGSHVPADATKCPDCPAHITRMSMTELHESIGFED